MYVYLYVKIYIYIVTVLRDSLRDVVFGNCGDR